MTDTNKLNDMTFVYRQITMDDVTELMKDPRWSAVARSDALEEKEKLENFIRDLSHGNVEYPEDAAAELMEEMGWA